MIKRYASILLIALCASCLLQSCLLCTLFAEEFSENDAKRIPIFFSNKSENSVYIYGNCFKYNYTVNSKLLIQYITEKTQLIHPDEIYNLNEITYTGHEKEYTYQFIIIKEETMNNNSQEDIINNNIYDDLLIFTYDELVEMNYEVIYTGKEEEPQNPNPGEPDL